MSLTLYRHFKFTFLFVEGEIKKLKALLRDDGLKNNEIRTKINNEIKDLKNSDVYLNFSGVSDKKTLEYIKNINNLDNETYKKLDKSIEKIINLIPMMYTKIGTSEENKKIDKWNYTDNENAKRIFLENYPDNPTEYIKALLSKSKNNLHGNNKKAKEKKLVLDKAYFDKELLETHIKLESMLYKNPTKNDIKRDVEYLLDLYMEEFKENKNFNNFVNIISEEVILRILKEKNTNKNLIDFAIEIQKVKLENISDEIKFSKDATPVEIWNSI